MPLQARDRSYRKALHRHINSKYFILLHDYYSRSQSYCIHLGLLVIYNGAISTDSVSWLLILPSLYFWVLFRMVSKPLFVVRVLSVIWNDSPV